MRQDAKLIPTSAQTVGPFFRIGFDGLLDRTPAIDPGTAGTVEISGRVLDRDGATVPDALLEFWCAHHASQKSAAAAGDGGFPGGFSRAATDVNGNFAVVMSRPVTLDVKDEVAQAPHMVVLVFSRGLLRHLISRVYFEDEPGNASDTVLQRVPAERQHTLIAKRKSVDGNSYRWDVILQGQDETVFFAW
jgi:protocatechuate 3,4-dioxygenase alpha subunit